MTTKRATLRKGKNIHGVTVARSSDTRAKRKAATARRMAVAAASAAAMIKAAGKPPLKHRPTKKGGAKAATPAGGK